MIGCFTGVMSVSMLFHVVSWSFHDCFHVGFMLVSTSPHLISRLVAWMFPWLLHPFSTINSLGAFFVSRRWFLRHLRLRSCLEWCCHGWGTHRENLGRTWRIFTWLGGLGVRESFSKCSKQFRFRNYRRICPDKSHPKKGNVSILTSVSFTWVAQPPPRWLNDQWTTTCCEFLKYQHFTRRLNDEHIFLWLKRF